MNCYKDSYNVKMCNPKPMTSYLSITASISVRHRLRIFLMQDKVKLTSELITVFRHLVRRVT